MALYKDLKEVKDLLKYWENYPAVNWLGKWAKSIRVEKLRNRVKVLENKILKLKNKNK